MRRNFDPTYKSILNVLLFLSKSLTNILLLYLLYSVQSWAPAEIFARGKPKKGPPHGEKAPPPLRRKRDEKKNT